jgi:membrane protein
VTKLERLIITSPPIDFLIRKSKKIFLPGFEGLPLYDVAVFFFRQTQQIGLNERAAAISFNFLMAIPPLAIVLFTILSHLPMSDKLYREALLLIRQITPDQSTYIILKSVMDDFFKPGSGTLSVSLIFAIFFASNAVITIMRTFNKSILHIDVEKRNFFEIRYEAMKLTILIITLIIGTMLIIVLQGNVLGLFRKWLSLKSKSMDWVVEVLRLGLTFFMVFFSIAFIYRFAPAIEKKWKLSSPGALLATCLIIAFTYVFSYWVNNIASYNKVYGSLGSILILMLLVFVNSLVLLIGFELNVSINSLKSIARRRQSEEGA